MELRFVTECYGAHHGQVDCVLRVFDGDDPLGFLDYSEFENRPHINMISVGVNHRRKGIGSALIRELAKEYSYENIEWGAMTPDGMALREQLDREFGVTRRDPYAHPEGCGCIECPCTCGRAECPECSVRKNPITFKRQGDKLLCGLCFPWAYKQSLEHDATLVHAIVTAPFSKPPQRYAHAWVELGGKVFDWQTMEAGHGGKYEGKGWPIKTFYETFRPEHVQKYTPEEAAVKALRTKHYGPWDDLKANTQIPRKIAAILDDLVKTAQQVYDCWKQDAEGHDEELGTGGICQNIAGAMIDVFSAVGIDSGEVSAQIGEQHVWVVVKIENGEDLPGVWEIDIHPSTYERGGGYTWRKIPGVTFDRSDILVHKTSDDPEDFQQMFDQN